MSDGRRELLQAMRSKLADEQRRNLEYGIPADMARVEVMCDDNTWQWICDRVGDVEPFPYRRLQRTSFALPTEDPERWWRQSDG